MVLIPTLLSSFREASPTPFSEFRPTILQRQYEMVQILYTEITCCKENCKDNDEHHKVQRVICGCILEEDGSKPAGYRKEECITDIVERIGLVLVGRKQHKDISDCGKTEYEEQNGLENAPESNKNNGKDIPECDFLKLPDATYYLVDDRETHYRNEGR